MMFNIPAEFIFLFVLALVYFVFATVQDIRFREVANWLSFSFIIFALVYRISYSVFAWDINFLIQGLFGLGVFVLLGYGLYYGRFFAGGDAKLLMGLGLVLPVYDNFASNFQLFLLFIFLMLFVGAIYGLIFSFVIALKNLKKFKKEFWKKISQSKKFFILSFILAILSLIIIVLLKEFVLLFFPLIILVLPVLYIYAKAVDEGCMVVEINIKNLVEGDWLHRDVRVGNKKIAADWDGVSKEDIKILQRLKGKVLVKQGIAFVPAILISFIIATFFISFSSGAKLVETVTPWFVILIVAIFFVVLLAGFTQKDLDKFFKPGFAWFFIGILGIIFLISLLIVYNSVLYPYLPGVNSSGGDETILKFTDWLYSSKIIGTVILLVLAGLASWALTRK